MPTRKITLIILLFWGATTVWMIQRDLWPRLAPLDPPFSIDLLDDSKPNQIPIRWSGLRRPDGETEPVQYTIETVTLLPNPKEDLLQFQAILKPRRLFGASVRAFQASSMYSSYFVSRERGQMVGFDVKVESRAGLPGVTQDLRSRFRATVEDRLCTLTWEKSNRLDARPETESFEVSHNGLVLLPLHPVYRMKGLTPGRTWGVWLFDGLACASLGADVQPTWVNARVRDREEDYKWNGRNKTCLVIDYEGRDVNGQTWVDVEENLVLRIVFRLGSESWDITRD